MATLAKRVQTRWYKGTERVPAGTSGARKVQEKSDHWYIVFKIEGRVRRVKAYTDKAASEAMLVEWNRAKERGQVGLTDPYKIHLDRPISEHRNEYIQRLKDSGGSAEHLIAVENRLERVIKGIGAKTLRDVTSDKVAKFLRNMVDARPKGGSKPVSITTKNDRRSAMFSFFKWMLLQDRIPKNIIEQVPRLKPQKGEESTLRKRRALSIRELKTLLQTAASYPLDTRQFNRGGRPRQDGAPSTPRPVKLTEETIANLTEQGRVRRLMYRLAVFTGLRRGELSRCRVRHLKLNKNLIDLPGELTKNGRRAIIPLVQELSNELRTWIVGKSQNDPLIVLPERNNLRRLHKAHLKRSSIDYQTDDGFADWHSLRKTVNTFLRRQKVPLRQRQRFLRHAAADLATASYDDERIADMKDVVRQFDRLWRYLSK